MSGDGTALGQRPLTRWQQTWRYLAALVISVVVFAGTAGELWRDHRFWFWSDIILGALAFALLRYRRRWPVPITILIILAPYSLMSAGPYTVCMVSLATHRRWSQIIPVSLVSLGAGTVYSSTAPTGSEPWYVNITLLVVFQAVLVASGMYIGARRELVATLQDRAERAEREQAFRVAQAQANERARIAREMHDVLAHRMSLVAMHSGALAYRTDLDGEETRRTAEVIQANAHLALTDLREVLGLLRDNDEPAEAARPLPTLRDVPELIGQARKAGMRVTLDNKVADLAAAPEAVGRHAYRMIQEGLTNARKHAPDTAVHVQLGGGPGGELAVEVRNPLRVGGDAVDAGAGVPSSGLGLIGLAERAILTGGRFEHGPTGSSEYLVRARLPWP